MIHVFKKKNNKMIYLINPVYIFLVVLMVSLLLFHSNSVITKTITTSTAHDVYSFPCVISITDYRPTAVFFFFFIKSYFQVCTQYFIYFLYLIRIPKKYVSPVSSTYHDLDYVFYLYILTVIFVMPLFIYTVGTSDFHTSNVYLQLQVFNILTIV